MKYMSDEYHRQRSKAHYEANKEIYNARKKERQDRHIKFIFDYKVERGCSHCGESEGSCLDMHHLDPTQKEGTIGSMSNYSMKKIQEELAKCIVLCANCHRKYHAGVIQLG